MTVDSVWLFHGEDARFAAAVFATRERAEAWIRAHRLSGILTRYPVDVSAYDWAIDKGFFTPKKDAHRTAEFIASFTSASQEHYHYESGSDGSDQ